MRYYLENESHVLFVCPFYNDLRIKYFVENVSNIPQSEHRLQSFMKTKWYIISKYLFDMFSLRRKVILARNK